MSFKRYRQKAFERQERRAGRQTERKEGVCMRSCVFVSARNGRGRGGGERQRELPLPPPVTHLVDQVFKLVQNSLARRVNKSGVQPGPRERQLQEHEVHAAHAVHERVQILQLNNSRVEIS